MQIVLLELEDHSVQQHSLCQVLLGDILQYGALAKNGEFQWTGTMRAESMEL